MRFLIRLRVLTKIKNRYNDPIKIKTTKLKAGKNLPAPSNFKAYFMPMNQDQQARWDEAIKGIKANTLTGVNLSSCGLSNEEEAERNEKIRQLAAALETNTALKYLLLGSNGIGDEGAERLAVALETNKTLTRLDFWHNDIGDDGAKALAVALEKNTALKDLNLETNNIGVEGADYLIELLERSPFLQRVNLSYNYASERLFERNPFLQFLQRLNCFTNSVSRRQKNKIESLTTENWEMVSTIVNNIVDAGWEVVPQGENPKGKGVELTPKEMVFITNPKGAKEVLEYIEEITAKEITEEEITEEKNAAENQINPEAQTEENLTVTTTFTSRLLKAMKENHEQNSNKNTENPHELSSDEKEKKEQDLVIPRGTLRKYYTLLSTLPFESLPKEVQDLAENFNLAKALQALGVTRKDVSKEVVETNSRSKKLLTELPRELLLQVLEYLGPRPLKYPLKKPLLEDSLSTPTAAAVEETVTLAPAPAPTTTAAPALTSTPTAAAVEETVTLAPAPAPTPATAPSPSIISRYFCNCLSGIFNRRNNGAQNPPSGRGHS